MGYALKMYKGVVLLLLLPFCVVGQLKEFEVTEMERPDVAVVQANAQFPDDALLLVYSSLDGLQFRSSMGAVDKQTYNNTAGRYEILVKPVKQMMFVAKPGFMELKISTINPNPKDVFYRKVEESEKDDIQALRAAVDSLKNTQVQLNNDDKQQGSPSALTQRLLDLKKLFDAGIISKEEYNSTVLQLKAEILETSGFSGSLEGPSKIGDLYGGGIVFELNENGKGMAVALEDIGVYDWSAAQTRSESFEGAGFDDWHLPSQEDLSKIEESLVLINMKMVKEGGKKMGLTWYWSKTEVDEEKAVLLNFQTGEKKTYDKKFMSFSRPVRSF